MIKRIISLLLALLTIIFVIAYKSDIMAQEDTLGYFTTKFNAGNVQRVKNIKLAVSALNNVVLYPGEIFSYNETIGPTTQKRGFEISKIFIKGKEAKGYGGGVCQVSTTLYNAALQADLTIIERHPHSKKVDYVPKDMDAATSYGGIDLKFRNDYDFPVLISAFISKNSVSIGIRPYYGVEATAVYKNLK